MVVQAVQGIDGRIEAQQNAVTTSLESIRGSISAQNVAAITSQDFSSDVNANESVMIYARYGIDAAVVSTDGSIYINAKSVNADASANHGQVGLNMRVRAGGRKRRKRRDSECPG